MARKRNNDVTVHADGYIGEGSGAKKSARNRADDAVGPDRWWNASQAGVAGKVSALAAQIETSTWSTSRYMQYVCARLMTGRAAPSGFGYSMTARSGRVASSMASALFNPPALNCVAVAADVFKNKVFKNRPWLTYTPTVPGDVKLRTKCKAREQYVDAAFEQLKVWDTIGLALTDCLQYPSGFVKTSCGLTGKELTVERVLSSEILLSNEDMGSYRQYPGSALQRVYAALEDLLDCFGRTDEIVQAIKNAPGVYAGFYKSGANYSDIRALVEGWKLPRSGEDGKPGRHVLAVGNCTLLDEPWKRDRLPFSKYDFNVLSNEYMGQSMAEIQLPLQRRLDRIELTIEECELRNGFPRWLIESSSAVDTDQFSGPGFVDYSGTAPVQIMGDVPKELYESRDAKMAQCFTRVGVSQQAAGGEKPEGLSSGLAILSWQQVDDTRHVDLAMRLEDFVADIGDQIFEVASEIKPSFRSMGHELIKWDDVDINSDKYKTTPMPLSRLPQTIAARVQQIQNWYDQGSITRDQKLRLEEMPDLQGYVQLATASEDWVAKALDTMVETGKYVPPLPYIDVASALRDAQARFLLESRWELPANRLRLVSQFIGALQEMPSKAPTPPPMPQQGAMPMPGQPPMGAPMPGGPPPGPM